jgi:hypothetical protein
MAFSPKEIAVRAIVPIPRRDTRPATTVEEFLANEIALADAFELAMLEELKRRNLPFISPGMAAECERRLIAMQAGILERGLNHTLRRVLKS